MSKLNIFHKIPRGVILILILVVFLFCIEKENSLAYLDSQRGITNVKVSNITQTSAKITYNTSSPQKTQLVCFDGCERYNDSVAAITHSFVIYNLSSGAEYSFFIILPNEFNSDNRQVYTFKTLLNLTRLNPPTLTLIDVVKPFISDIQITEITTSGAHINWKTDENSTSVVVLSGGGLLEKIITNVNQTSVTQHTVNLKNLNTHTLYSFKIKSKDGSGNEAVSTSRNFSTLGVHPVISNVRISNISSTGARIKWTTNKDTTGRIMYAVKNTSNNAMVKHDNIITQHDLSLNDLEPDTKYVYRVESADSDNIWAYSSVYEFQTEPIATDESQDNSSNLGSGATAGQDASLADDQTSLTTGTAIAEGNSGLINETTNGLANSNLAGTFTNPISSNNTSGSSWKEKAASLINSSLAFMGIKNLPKFNLSQEKVLSYLVKLAIIIPLIIIVIIIILKICKKPTNNKK